MKANAFLHCGVEMLEKPSVHACVRAKNNYGLCVILRVSLVGYAGETEGNLLAQHQLFKHINPILHYLIYAIILRIQFRFHTHPLA